jgi:RND family efflux transporter MFP subunit
VAIGAGLVLLAATGILMLMRRARADTGHAPAPDPLPTVAVARVEREDLFKEVTIPAEFRPYTEVELHAKISGYLGRMNVDFGDRVTAGQLLATLEVPELKDDLDHAVAAERRAEADYKDAHLVFTRVQGVNQEHPNLLAQQDLDTAEARDATAAAALAAARADVQKLQTMMAYTQITAPFSGVITRRYADPGALIQAGTASDTQSKPLVRLSDNYRLRLDFPVSVTYVKDIQAGDTVQVRVDSLGGKTMTGAIRRFTSRVNSDTRTMTAEIEVPNPDLVLVPGMYATVALRVERRPGSLTIPTEAISSGSRTTVYVVNGRGEIEERTVTLGLETPTRYEVSSGLSEGDLVMIGNRSSVHPGQKVEARAVEALTRG